MDLSAAKCLQGIYSTLLYVISCRKTFSWCGQFWGLSTFEGAHNLRNALMQICCKTFLNICSAIKNGGMVVVSYNFLSYSVRRILPLDIYGMV